MIGGGTIHISIMVNMAGFSRPDRIWGRELEGLL